MPIARPNGQPQDVVRHLTTRCGMSVEVAERLVPNREGIEDSPRTALTPDALDTYRHLVMQEYAEEPELRAVLLLLPVTGLRVAEICGLMKENLRRDGDKVSWTFHGKGDKERTVPLWRKARRVFDPYMAERRPDVFLFPNKSDRGPIAPSKVQEACRHIAGLDPSLKHLTPHVLRHTFATMALLNCHDIKRTQEILGHGKKNSVKIPVVMLRYLHPDVERSTPNSSKPLAARRNPEQNVPNGAGMVPDEIYERLKREGGMLPVPGKRGRVYVYSHRRGDVVEVSEARARTWLTLGETARDLREAMASGIRQRYRPEPVAVPAPEPLVPVPAASSLPLFASEPPAAPKRTRKKSAAKENPMNDDWYWKAIYSNVPPGPSRAHPVAQRNGTTVLYTAKGQPYKYVDGRPRFISKAEAASIQRQEKQSRRNPAGAHGAFDQMIDPFSVYEQRFDGEQPYARRNGKKSKAKKSKAKKNHHMVWEQIISPFSVAEARTYGRQPIGRRNPAGAHGAFDQMIDPFSVYEQRFDGEQPYARRNKSRKAKKNGVVRVYQIK